jgi:hypothetical protein
MAHDALTFGLAVAAYALLALDAALRWRRRRVASLTAAAAVTAVAHVLCVWAFRFGWDAGAAWRKSAAGFVIFHGALTLLLLAAAWRARRDALVLAAFAVVSAGALPAPFRYPELRGLRVPVAAIGALAAGSAVLDAVRRRSARGPAKVARGDPGGG